MNKLSRLVLLASILSVAGLPGCAISHISHSDVVTKTQPSKSAIEKWQAMRFGLFIHFGAYADLAGVWQGKEIEKLGEQIQRHADISQEDYQQVVKKFNPSNFDADAVVKLAKQAGMRYIVLTTKHHDGFSLFDSQHTDFDIVDYTPYKKDLLQQLSQATKRHGLKLGIYYSTPDWHFNAPHPERDPADGKISVFGKVSKANEDFQVAQLEELMTNYGEIVEVFFDMGEPTLAQSKRFREVVKKHQPNALINGRIMNDQGDFLTMPDNHVPDSPITSYPWETPGTFYHTWGYKSWVKGLPLAQQIGVQVRKLSDIASMGGNFLLNIGPKGDGSILAYEKEVLQGVGRWVDINQEAIFNTGLNPFLKLDWGQVSTKGNNLYLHIHQWPKDNQLVVPGLVNAVVSAATLAASAPQLTLSQINGDTVIDLSNVAKDPYLTIIKLNYGGNLAIIPEHATANSQGQITLAGSRATKHGKYGKQSYRSMLKDFYRSWYLDVPTPGTYQVTISYQMKYAEKDFILAAGDNELIFSLNGKGKKVETAGAFDGNETITGKEKLAGNFRTTVVGELTFSAAGIQKLLLKQGQPFELMASTKDFKAQDQRYRTLNLEIADIKLIRSP